MMESTLKRANGTTINESYELKKLISLYVSLENSQLSRRAYAVKFSQAIAVNINKLYNGSYTISNESKDYKNMMSRFNDVVRRNLNTTACIDFLDYFYRKFLDEIKAERYKVTGKVYSKNRRVYQ